MEGNATGVSVTADQQANYNIFLATEVWYGSTMAFVAVVVILIIVVVAIVVCRAVSDSFMKILVAGLRVYLFRRLGARKRSYCRRT